MFAYIDGKLSPKEQHVVEKHLLDCDLCADALEGLSSLKNRERIKALNKAVLEKISKPEAKVIRINKRWIVSVAAGLLLLLGGVFFFNMFVSNSMKEDAMAELNEPALETITADPSAKADSMSPPPPPASASTIVTEEASDLAEAENTTEADKKTQKIFDGEGFVSGPVQEITTKDVPNSKPVLSGEKTKEEQPQLAAPDVNNNIAFNTTPVAGTTSSNNEKTILAKEKAKDQIELDDESDRSKNTSTGAGNTWTTKENRNDEGGTVARENKQAKVNNAKGKKVEDKKRSEEQKEDKPNKSAAGDVAANAPVELAQSTTETANFGALTDSISTSGYLDENLKVAQNVEELPEYPGGEKAMNKFLIDNLKWPAMDGKDGLVSSKIYVQFVVDKDGSVKDAKVLRGINAAFDAEALRVVKLMPKWKPGKMQGKVMSTTYNLPIIVDFK